MAPRKTLIAAAVLVAIALIAASLGGWYLLGRSTPGGTSAGAAPTVTSTWPVLAATGTAINTKIVATFSKSMDPATITTSTFSLSHGTMSVPGAVTYTDPSATFTPSGDLIVSTAYTATITTGAKDAGGQPVAVNFVWTFTSGVTADTTPPVVVSTSATSAVPVASDITATFSKMMDPATMTPSTFTLATGSTSIAGAVTYAGLTATFDPSSDLSTSTAYVATLTTNAKDLAGNAMAGNFVWSLTTVGSSSSCAQLPVALGAAGGFAVLAGSTVTNTGPTTVTGDLGVSPGSAVTGFPPGTVTGTIQKTNTAAAAGKSDLTIAYNDAAGRTLCPVSLSGNLGGMTLTPGLYKSTSGFAVTSGYLTLDARGDPNAVFIFQMASTLVTSAGLKVILTGGAQASNVFWQVGTSATLGTNSTFVGTIMANEAVSLAAGASLDGRALARIGAVTMQTNSVAKP